jgi:hypothetical protein
MNEGDPPWVPLHLKDSLPCPALPLAGYHASLLATSKELFGLPMTIWDIAGLSPTVDHSLDRALEGLLCHGKLSCLRAHICPVLFPNHSYVSGFLPSSNICPH